MQKSLYHRGWSDEEKCRTCNKEEGTEKHRLYRCLCWKEARNQIPERLVKWEQKTKTSNTYWKWRRGITSQPLERRTIGKKPLDSAKMGIRKVQELDGAFPVESYQNHLATDGSSLGVSGKWGACGCSVVQLDHDQEMGPMHGMYGTVDAELEVQRTNKRAEQTAFLCLFRKAIGPTMVHFENKGIISGLWRGEVMCIGRRTKDADLWILIWEEFQISPRRHTGGG